MARSSADTDRNFLLLNVGSACLIFPPLNQVMMVMAAVSLPTVEQLFSVVQTHFAALSGQGLALHPGKIAPLYMSRIKTNDRGRIIRMQLGKLV